MATGAWACRCGWHGGHQLTSNTAVCLQAALPAAVCRRQGGVTTAAPQRRCPRIHRTGRPHTRAVARSVRASSMGASQHHNPALGCLSVIYLLSAPGSAVGPLVASLPPPLCRALAPRLYLHPRVLRGGLTRQCEARGLVGPRGCTSTPAAACLRNPHFHGRRTAAHWWLRRGTATRALVLVVAHALDKSSGRPLASGMGRSARHTAVLGLPAPPSGPRFRRAKTRPKTTHRAISWALYEP